MIDIETYFSVMTYIMFGIFGLLIGSFLNVVIYRVPLGMSIAFPPSHCPSCDSKIKWYDNIPVLSYILLGGKCRNCKKHISFRYTAVEISNTLLYLAAYHFFKEQGLVYAILCSVTFSLLICVFFIDLEHQLIFDRFQIILGVIGAAVTLLEKNYLTHIIGGAAGFLSFFLIALIGSAVAKRDAMGGGDIKLCAVMGLFLGWKKLLLSVIIASLCASVILLCVRAAKKESGKEYPFGPFLATGWAISMLFGDMIINAYISLLIK